MNKEYDPAAREKDAIEYLLFAAAMRKPKKGAAACGAIIEGDHAIYTRTWDMRNFPDYFCGNARMIGAAADLVALVHDAIKHGTVEREVPTINSFHSEYYFLVDPLNTDNAEKEDIHREAYAGVTRVAISGVNRGEPVIDVLPGIHAPFPGHSEKEMPDNWMPAYGRWTRDAVRKSLGDYFLFQDGCIEHQSDSMEIEDGFMCVHARLWTSTQYNLADYTAIENKFLEHGTAVGQVRTTEEKTGEGNFDSRGPGPFPEPKKYISWLELSFKEDKVSYAVGPANPEQVAQ